MNIKSEWSLKKCFEELRSGPTHLGMGDIRLTIGQQEEITDLVEQFYGHNQMEVVKCGTNAIIKVSQAEATVTAISIRFGRTSYELTYFHNGDYKTVWMDESEFTINDSKTRIGFK